jgi:hypothetical protein
LAAAPVVAGSDRQNVSVAFAGPPVDEAGDRLGGKVVFDVGRDEAWPPFTAARIQTWKRTANKGLQRGRKGLPQTKGPKLVATLSCCKVSI